METRHDGTDRNHQRSGNLLVGQLLHVTQQDDVLVCLGYSAQGREHFLIGEVLGHGRDERRSLGEAVVRILDGELPRFRPRAGCCGRGGGS